LFAQKNFKKSFSGTPLSILSEIHQEFCKIQHLAKKNHARHFDPILNTP
jgi:hypothetical protein